jgi:hypothetical protein
VRGKQTVFILGSGFSRALGGPLLPGLLSPAGTRRARSAFDNWQIYGGLFGDIPNKASQFYVQDLQLPAAQRNWEDAEDYLAHLDTAAEGGDASPAARFLKKLDVWDASILGGTGAIEKLRAAAVRLVAAECSAFLAGDDSHLLAERWDRTKPGLRQSNPAIA